MGLRGFVIDNRLDPFDVEASGSEVCSKKERYPPISEVLHAFNSLEKLSALFYLGSENRSTYLFLAHAAM
jgi:hypothetical protein